MSVATVPPQPKLSNRNLIFREGYTSFLSAGDNANVGTVARQMLRENPRLDQIPPFGPLCRIGAVDAPSLLIEDHSGIQLAHERGADQSLSYRAAMLAGDGDLLAVYGERDEDFEAYCREVLGLGDVAVLAPAIANSAQTLSQVCLEDVNLIALASKIAREAGALNIVPYMVTGGVWRLAKRIANDARVPMHVVGPGPTLARAVNDKLWFAHCASMLLGRNAVPHNRTVYGMSALVGHLQRFVKEHHVVGLKLPSSAASLGNMVLESPQFSGKPATMIAAQLAEAINQRGWKSPFPLQLTAWEGPLLASPSVQLWIPLPSDGPPIIEGIFDQQTSGENGRFVGGAPSLLSERLKRELAREAACLGTVFQRLGYFGRCSFDAVVVGKDEARADLHWVECNGRWGGVSLPMTLANRLVGDWREHGFLVFSHFDPNGVPPKVSQLLDRCEDLLFRQDRPSGLVLLTPGRLSYGGGDFLVIAADQDAAERLSEEAVARLSAPS